VVSSDGPAVGDAMRGDVERTVFGRFENGTEIEKFVLSDGTGRSASVLTYGARLHSLVVPDRAGALANVVGGYASLAEYECDPHYMGATIGRFANRLRDGRFEIDGAVHRAAPNEGSKTLHGGPHGFDRAVWRFVRASASPHPTVVLAHTSPDGDQGFPGEVCVEVAFALRQGGRLSIEYAATTNASTIVNLTHHAYWNLHDADTSSDASDHRIMIPSDRYVPVDEDMLPTGERLSVEGSPFDFRTKRCIGDDIDDPNDRQIAIAHGYDHSWLIGEGARGLRNVALLESSRTGRRLEVWSDQSAIHLYSGNFLGEAGAGRKPMASRSLIALEAQNVPDAPNLPWAEDCILRPGETYRSTIIYQLGVAPDNADCADASSAR
jgi:aldose 1-epimerase